MAAPAAFHSDNPIVQRILSGSAPAPIKLAAARGALPLSPEELFHVVHALSADPDPAVQEALPATVAGFPDEVLAGLLRNPQLPPQALDFYARAAQAKSPALVAIVTNRATADGTLERLAVRPDPELLELLVTNQVALIRAPRLIDALLENSALAADQRRRLLEVREEFFTKKELEERRRRDEEERLARLREKKEWTLQELEKLQEELAREAHADQSAGALPPDLDEAGAAETDEEYQSATQRVMTMSVPEKILLAIRGNRTERNLLIKDSNRLVSTSAIKSPKVTDKDIEYYASLRNINDEILRIIGTRRDWLKSYAVVHTLVKNPRTPLAIGINLLPRLQSRDLKILEGDRNVSETLRRQAKQFLDKANKAAGGHR